MSSYYRPYTSGSDSDSESESEGSSIYSTGSDTSTDASKPSKAPANFRALAEGLSLTSLAGPSFDLSGEVIYAKNPLGYPLNAEPLTLANYEIKPDASGTQLKASTQSVNSIIMLNSTDRDRKVYKQPTNVTLRLPRVYSNVTSFQLVQIKLLSSFYYFRASKQNISVSILENGRTVGQNVDAIVESVIREGTYDINSLLTELTTELNYTPLFYDFPNGFQEFAIRFASTGDFFVGFNQPGDNYYDSLADTFIQNPTVTTIISRYFENRYAGLSSYTTDQIKVAYYYPVLKEALLDQGVVTINLDVSANLLPGETPYSRCIYTFQGINDQVALAVINLNFATLDEYRLLHTFRYGLVNKYTATLQAQSNKITIATTSLNTSLVNLITGKQAQFLSEQLTENSLTQAQFAALQTQNSLLLAVLNDMFYYLQQYLAIYFGIPFNTYDISYIANPNYYVPIRDATNAIGISSNFDASVISRNTLPITTNIISQFQQGAPHYWPGFSNIDVLGQPFNLDSSSNHPYSVLNDVLDTTRAFVDLSSDQLYVNQLLRYTDIVVPLEAAQYTIFRFKSPVRQTLQIETLPRPTKYRYLAYNAQAYDRERNALFDGSYCFVNTQPDALDWILNRTTPPTLINPVPGYEITYELNPNFGISYQAALNYWNALDPPYIRSYVGNNVALYGFYTSAPAVGAPAYRYSMAVTITTPNGSNFVTPTNMFIYHDRGAFLADLSSNGAESPFNYIAAASTTATVSSATANFSVYAGQTYYILSRSNQVISATQNYCIVPWCPSQQYDTLTDTLDGFDPLADPTTPAALLNTNYAVVNDPAFIRLPTSSNLVPPTKVDPLYAPLTYSTVAIGYDASGVSTDATDYFGYTPNEFGTESGSTFRIDPINGYIMQKLSPYNTSTQTYFYSNSENTLLGPGGSNLYTPKTVAKRETSIVHPFYTHYLPASENQAPIPSNGSIPPTYVSPFDSASTTSPIGGYIYGGSNDDIQLGDGVIGISFVPQQGSWSIERAMFASVYNGKTSDPNLQIAYLGVFLASSLPTTTGINPNNPNGYLQLSNSIAVLKASGYKAYDGSQNSVYDNFGFGVGGGSFYEFTRDYTYIGSNQNVYGYSQIRREFNPDSNSIYTLVPFDSLGNLYSYYGLLGSLVPYPLINNTPVDVSNAYFDGNAPDNGNQLLVPVPTSLPLPPVSQGGPPPGYDETQSKYELSMPIGTTVTHYLTPYDFLTNPNAMLPLGTPQVINNAVFECVGRLITFDAVFHVYSYPVDSPSQPIAVPFAFQETYQFTVDQIIDPTVNSAYIGMAANTERFAFFSYSPGNLYIKTMDPMTGLIVSDYVAPSPFDFSSANLINATYNNDEGFAMSVNDASGTHAYCQLSRDAPGITISYVVQDPAVEYFIVRQSAATYESIPTPFYVFISSGGIQEFAIVRFDVTTTVIDPRFTVDVPPGINIDVTVYSLGGIYTNPVISRNPYRDYISFLQPGSGSIFEITSYVGTAAVLTPTVYTFPEIPNILYQGSLGAIWALSGPFIYGNRGGSLDAPKNIAAAWQIFYPMQRIAFTKVANNFTFMQDTTNLKYPEYPHTAITVYDSLAKLQGDLGIVTDPSGGRWGLETSGNILAADFGFSGEVFNASIFSVPLQASAPGSYYYAAVRNYTPTEKSQVILRCSLNNRYDFGYVRLTDLSGEVGIAATSSNMFSPEYYAQLLGFNSNFTFAAKTFGANIIPGFNGSNFTNVTGWGDFYSRFTTLYATYNAQVQLVQSITSNVNSNVNAFIQSDLKYILPSSAQYRQRFTDPLTFSILWKSALSPEYAKLEDQWGLGWNLGYDKLDTPYSTVHTAPSFFKILDDYINLRLNPEYDMNRVDTGSKENLYVTQDTTGSTKAFHAKLLLASFGSYAQTLISNPVSFMPPLGRMDKLTFQWLDTTETQIDNSDCEWNVVIQIVEKKEIVEIPKAALVYNGRA